MEDRKERGYPIYSEDELGAIQQVASSGDCTGLEPTPPITAQEAQSYSSLYNTPQTNKKSKK